MRRREGHALLWTILTIANYALAAVAIIMILRKPREPRAMLAWILAVLLLPVVGLLAFALIGQPRLERTVRRRRRRRQKLAIHLTRHEEELLELHAIRRLEGMEPAIGKLMKLATRVSASPATYGNQVRIYRDEERSIQTICESIEAARHHVHLEYYIFRSDETGCMVRDALVAAARRGVECRVLMDYIGCWSTSRAFIRSMRDAGVEVDYFLPVVPWQGRWRINFRNHRKILVVDGHFAFTGSHNIGDEYRGRHPTLGPWQDTNLSIKGPAVQQLQEIFVEDWHYSSGIELTSNAYFPHPGAVGPHIVQVVHSGPDTEINAIHDVVFSAISAAQESIRIITPYFVPDAATLQALQSAACRGVRVQVLVPSKTDNVLTLWAGRSFYPELNRAGVEIYEYDGGMLHNKLLIVDECWSMVGSANIDHRSFRINFEVSTVLYDSGLARELLAEFEQFWTRARRITKKDHQDWRFGETLTLGAARLISPIL